MNPFNDSIPEEIETQQSELVSMLRRASTASMHLTPEEQAQIIAHARARLLHDDQAVSAGNAQTAQAAGVVDSAPLKPPSRPVALRRRGSISRCASLLAALLLLAIVLGTSILIYKTRPTPIQEPGVNIPAPVNSLGTLITVRSKDGGLEMSLSLTPGSYFLSELLAADISLTNHTRNTEYVGLPFAGSGCGYVTGVQITGGGAPTYTIPISTDHSCPAFVNTTSVKSGQTLTVRRYISLTSSGQQTLTAQTEFFTSPPRSQNPFPRQVASPFDGHWPSMQIDVGSQVPANRTISFHRDGTRVTITAPNDAQHPLLYLYGVSCQDYNDQGGTGSGNYGWEHLQKNIVGEPGCPGKNVRWAFAFAVPGYAIVGGNVTFPGNSPNP